MQSEAILWITTYLSLDKHGVIRLQRLGLRSLKVFQLKALYQTLRNSGSVRVSPLGRKPNKLRYVEIIDEALTRIDILQKLPTHPQHPAPTTPQHGHLPPLKHGHLQSSLSITSQPQNYEVVSPLTNITTSTMTPPMIHKDVFPIKPESISSSPMDALMMNFNHVKHQHNTQQQSLHSTKNDTQVLIPTYNTNHDNNINNNNINPDRDTTLPFWESHPTIRQLQFLGIHNRHELQQAILANPTGSTDDCLLWILQQRDEQTDAIQMDTARLQSEEQESMENSQRISKKEEEELNHMIQNSHPWIERCLATSATTEATTETATIEAAGSSTTTETTSAETTATTMKSIVYQWLKLELNCNKWYRDWSHGYFQSWTDRWNVQPPSELELQSTLQEVEQSVYFLEGHLQGIPRIFHSITSSPSSEDCLDSTKALALKDQNDGDDILEVIVQSNYDTKLSGQIIEIN